MILIFTGILDLQKEPKRKTTKNARILFFIESLFVSRNAVLSKPQT